MITILVVEDDKDLNHIVCSFLHGHGYKIISASNGMEAFEKMETEAIHMIISDIMMPEMDGYAFAEHIRSMDSKIPILFMSAREDMPSKQRGFTIGIDDYMVKPIELDELLLRITALLRRADIAVERRIQVGQLCLREDEMTVEYDGEEIPFTVKEFNILFRLLSYPKKIFTRMQLMDEFWGMDSESNPRTVDVSITKIREKLAECQEIEIVTVRGMGYKAVIRT